MPLENADFISGLSVVDPSGEDGGNTADDHLRLIKSVLKNTFPNLNDAVNVTPEFLNGLADTIANGSAGLFELIKQHLVPTGTIMMWSGLSSELPAGWELCDGNGGRPDYRDYSPMGAGGSYAVNATYGSLGGATASNGAHSHGGKTANHTLTTGQIPSHSHVQKKYNPSEINVSLNIRSDYPLRPVGPAFSYDLEPTTSVGSNQGHQHNISEDGGHTHGYSSLHPVRGTYFIIKTSETPTEQGGGDE